jgi:hypothetical protein
MKKNLSGYDCLAKHGKRALPSVKPFGFPDEHPLGNIKITFSSYGIEPGMVLKVRFLWKVQDSDCPQSSVCHPRRISYNKHWVSKGLKH